MSFDLEHGILRSFAILLFGIPWFTYTPSLLQPGATCLSNQYAANLIELVSETVDLATL